MIYNNIKIIIYTGAKKCMGFSKLPISKWKAISMR
jgi:hypothetical protein